MSRMVGPANRTPAGRIRGILLDLDGVVHVRGAIVPGSLQAIAKIRKAGLPFKFVTNTTRRPLKRIVADILGLGVDASAKDVYTPAALARDFLLCRGLSPFLVVHPDLREDFQGLPTGGAEAVVIGDAGEFFAYDLLNAAYRKILRGAPFLALAKNRNFRDCDGELSLDVGAFVAGLEYASGREAVVLGKPAPMFFSLALEGLGCAAEDAAMIGDDAEADVAGAMAAGLRGVLVRTGKYRAGDEAKLERRPSAIADNLKGAVDLLLD
ncbi:MAG TPA: TIGR01458 family HAD-type hydrolase [Methylocystis sp.]|nr:TIGR01458 family HAD-type hydrolase [Methylocystis sp.]